MIGSKEKCLRWLETQSAGIFEIKEFDKRSMSQNSYYWALISELGEITGKTNDELHMEMLRDYSTARIVACSPQVNVHDFVKYCEIDLQEDNVVYWRCYKGSSEMTKKEFKRLLDGVIEECKNCGIEVMTEQELARLRR